MEAEQHESNEPLVAREFEGSATRMCVDWYGACVTRIYSVMCVECTSHTVEYITYILCDVC